MINSHSRFANLLIAQAMLVARKLKMAAMAMAAYNNEIDDYKHFKHEDVRSRSANFTPAEKNLLLDLIERYKSIIESRNLDSVTSKMKENTWIKLTNEYNGCLMPSGHRETKQLKKCYNNMKKSARKTASYYLDRRFVDSDLCPAESMLTPIEARLLSMLDESSYASMPGINNTSSVTTSKDYCQDTMDDVVVKMEDSDETVFSWQQQFNLGAPSNISSGSLDHSTVGTANTQPLDISPTDLTLGAESNQLVDLERSGFVTPPESHVTSVDDPLSSMSSTSRSVSESSVEFIPRAYALQPTQNKNKSHATIITERVSNTERKSNNVAPLLSSIRSVVEKQFDVDEAKRKKLKRKMEIVEIEHAAKMAVLESERKAREIEIEAQRVELDNKNAEFAHRRNIMELELEGKRIELDIKKAQLKLLEENKL